MTSRGRSRTSGSLEGVLPRVVVEAKRQYPEPKGRRGGGARRRERDPRRLMTPKGVGGFSGFAHAADPHFL